MSAVFTPDGVTVLPSRAAELGEILDLHRELDAFLNARDLAMCEFLPLPHEQLGYGVPACSGAATHLLQCSCEPATQTLCCAAITGWLHQEMQGKVTDCVCGRLLEDCWSLRPV